MISFKIVYTLLFLVVSLMTIKLHAASLQKVSFEAQNDTAKDTLITELQKYPAFFKKHIDADGILIMGSDKVNDTSFEIAKSIVIKMLAKIPDVKKAMINNHTQIILVAYNEEFSDIPEFKGFDTMRDQDGNILNKRLRGLSLAGKNLFMSCGEETLLCSSNDTHRGENIFVHEFAHTIANLGINVVDTTFLSTLKGIYNRAKNKQLWKNTYAMASFQEYFAEGVQCWFNVCRKSIPGDGVFNEIGRRSELKFYDPELYNLLSKYFFPDDSIRACN